MQQQQQQQQLQMRQQQHHSVYLFIIASFASILFSGCSNNRKIESVISGIWVVDSIYYNSQDYRSCMGVNMIEFTEAFKAPLMNDGCNMIHENPTNDWKIIKSKETYFLELNSINRLFNAKHTIYFEDDKKSHLLKMKLVHDKGYIVCSKVLFNYDASQNLINELVTINR